MKTNGDVNDLSNKLIRLLKDKEISLKLGKTGKLFVEANFDNRIMVKKHRDFYESLIS